MKAVLYVMLFFGTLAAYPAWNALTWTNRLEVEATDTIERPAQPHAVIELQGFSERSWMIVDLAMSEGVTVALQHIDNASRYTGFTAASGPVCEGPNAVFRATFVGLGFYDTCLQRKDIDPPADALILRILREHRFQRAGWGGGFVVWRWDPVAEMEEDDAWIIELAERSDGRERLLGRVVATELVDADGRPSLLYWPAFPEYGERLRWTLERKRAESDRPDEVRYAFMGARSGYVADRFHEPVHRLSTAMLDRALGHPLHGKWEATAEPDPIRVLDFAETLLFSGRRPETTFGSNLVTNVMGWARRRDHPHEELRRQVKARGVDIGMHILDDQPTELDRNVLGNIMFNASSDQMQALFVKLAERNGTKAFHRYQRFFDRMTGPLPPHVCEAGREWLEDYEARNDHQFALCP